MPFLRRLEEQADNTNSEQNDKDNDRFTIIAVIIAVVQPTNQPIPHRTPLPDSTLPARFPGPEIAGWNKDWTDTASTSGVHRVRFSLVSSASLVPRLTTKTGTLQRASMVFVDARVCVW